MEKQIQAVLFCQATGREPAREWLKQDLSLADRKTVGTDIEGAQMILLHGFIKKTQKTPKADLDTALKRLKELKYDQ